jgi:hypothetical protein
MAFPKDISFPLVKKMVGRAMKSRSMSECLPIADLRALQ